MFLILVKTVHVEVVPVQCGLVAEHGPEGFASPAGRPQRRRREEIASRMRCAKQNSPSGAQRQIAPRTKHGQESA